MFQLITKFLRNISINKSYFNIKKIKTPSAQYQWCVSFNPMIGFSFSFTQTGEFPLEITSKMWVILMFNLISKFTKLDKTQLVESANATISSTLFYLNLYRTESTPLSSIHFSILILKLTFFLDSITSATSLNFIENQI